jgi:hypothetical protein
MIDARRLARAVHLDCEPLPDGRWTVSGGALMHFVRETRRGLVCDCVDAGLGRECKHVIRVRFALGDAEVLRALRQLIPVPKQRRARQATAGTSRREAA